MASSDRSAWAPPKEKHLMQLRSKSVVFAIAAALGAGLTVPGALALSGGSSSDPQTKPAVQPVEQTHEADAAEQHEAAQSEHTTTTEAADDQAKAEDTTPSTATPNPKAFGATGDEHRSDVAAEHSQADAHRATGPGSPADQSATTPKATGTDDEATDVEDEHAEHEDRSGP